MRFGGDFEGFLGSPPGLPHTNVAGAKLEIVLFSSLGSSIHTTATASENLTDTHWPRCLAFKYAGWTTGGPGTARGVNEEHRRGPVWRP